MARWRAEAIARLPELRETIEQSHQLMFLWTELQLVFERAYREPTNDDLIRRIYDFARWCEQAPRDEDAGRDPLTCVCVGFYKHVPTNAAARADMHRWFSVAELLSGRSVFAYHIGEEDFERLVSEIRAKHR